MADFEAGTGTASTSLSLIHLVKAGDREAWQRLARIYSPLVYRWARQSHLQDSDAADVLQDVFLAVLNGIERFRYERPEDSLRAWLRTITRNEVRRFCRRRLHRPSAAGGSDAQRQLQQLPEDLGDLLDYARKSRPSVRHLLASTRTRSFYSKEREEGVRLAVVGCE